MPCLKLSAAVTRTSMTSKTTDTAIGPWENLTPLLLLRSVKENSMCD